MKGPIGKTVGICLFFIFGLVGCAGRETTPAPTTTATSIAPCPKPPSTPPPTVRGQKPYQINGIWYYPIPSAEGYVEEGVASWYGKDFHGLPTACGETYDMYGLTAAHKTLPLGTYVKVTNRSNGRSVVLRVNDRGPFVGGRLIDLSLKAAQELGIDRPGTAPVRVEAVQVASTEVVAGASQWHVDPIPDFRHGRFSIQIGAFVEQRNADRLKSRMSNRYNSAQVIPFDNQGTLFYRVQIGAYGDLVLAQQEMSRLRKNGFGGAFVVASEEQK